ncbi:MAG: S41 family peptidase [Acidobacteria bacterium]|jgi:carboxyl-terminal processing protease|nr:S41 family peptidase [Acidobacteriota bacterium]MBP8274153.1 S41 family peptidase [Acidobacteriota bacterium]
MLKTIPVAALIVAASAAAGGVIVGQAPAVGKDRLNDRYRVYTAALAAIERDYVEPVDAAPAVYGSIDGMLRTLDPHSSFFDPRSYAQMRERQEGRYPGIGVTIVAANDDVTVTALFEGSPAYKAGIRRGDVIAKVGTESAKGWTTQQVSEKIRGPKGSTVNVSIRRPGSETLIELTVPRDEITIVTVRASFMLQPGTGYIRLQDFSETSDEEIQAALKKLSAQGMTQLVLDLRDNPGGPLDQAIAIASHFLKRGQMVVYTRGRVQNSDQDYPATVQGNYPSVPLIVMVSRGSASASEIVAGAMQDHDRAIIVGEQTFGKALVQSVYRIANGAGLALTTGRYYTPSGRMIQRPWDGAFDDYLTYGLRDQNEHRDHAASELKYTDGGRKVYGGGGIEPDHFMAGPTEGFNPSYFSRQLNGRGMFVGFAERFTAEGDDRPANRRASSQHKVTRGFEVTPEILAEFKQYVASQRMKIDDAAFAADANFIKAMIHYEADVDLFGVEEARRQLLKVDPQAQFALGFFDEAKALIAKK